MDVETKRLHLGTLLASQPKHAISAAYVMHHCRLRYSRAMEVITHGVKAGILQQKPFMSLWRVVGNHERG